MTCQPVSSRVMHDEVCGYFLAGAAGAAGGAAGGAAAVTAVGGTKGGTSAQAAGAGVPATLNRLARVF